MYHLNFNFNFTAFDVVAIYYYIIISLFSTFHIPLLCLAADAGYINTVT